MIKVMYVCLGNICRSPLAEAIMNQRIIENGLGEQISVESCGTAAYHIGENPDPRTIRVAKNHGIPVSHKAQQLTSQHYNEFDYFLLMDDSNLNNAEKIKLPNTHAVSYKMRDFDSESEGADVADPWFGEEDGFEDCYRTLDRCVNEFLHFLVNKHNLTAL